jgi:hypothetical protein
VLPGLFGRMSRVGFTPEDLFSQPSHGPVFGSVPGRAGQRDKFWAIVPSCPDKRAARLAQSAERAA